MRQFAIIGLDIFGERALEELAPLDISLLIVDKNEAIIQNYKNRVAAAYVMDVTKMDALEKIIPKTIDVAIVDLGENIEAAMLVTNFLKGLGIKQIVVKADTDQQGKILKILGATMVIFPQKEAIRRVIPMLISPLLLNYLTISEELIIAEVCVPVKFIGMTLIDANLRKNHQLNVIAIKNTKENQYQNFSLYYQFAKDDVILVSGDEKHISEFVGQPISTRSKTISGIIKNFLSGTAKKAKKTTS